jgi:hypothetical protein
MVYYEKNIIYLYIKVIIIYCYNINENTSIICIS